MMKCKQILGQLTLLGLTGNMKVNQSPKRDYSQEKGQDGFMC